MPRDAPIQSTFIDYVVVVESLRMGDDKTGADLYDLVIRPYCDAKGLNHRFKAVRSKHAFFDFLDALHVECRVGRHSPVLHIECHGNEDGLEIGGEFVPWQEIKPRLIALNVVSRLNLLVVLAACSGINLIRVLSPIDRAPAWGIIGPKARRVDPHDLFTDLSTFYREFLSSLDGRRALELANGGPPSPQWRYGFTPAQWFFKTIYREYVRTHATPKALRNRARKAAQVATGMKHLPSKNHPLAKVAAAKLHDQQHFFDQFRSKFFMYDLYAENKKRFPVAFSDVSSQGI